MSNTVTLDILAWFELSTFKPPTWLLGTDQGDQIGRFIGLWATFQSLWATFMDIWRLFTGHTGTESPKQIGIRRLHLTFLFLECLNLESEQLLLTSGQSYKAL